MTLYYYKVFGKNVKCTSVTVFSYCDEKSCFLLSISCAELDEKPDTVLLSLP